MAKPLLEKYGERLKISEGVYARDHGNMTLDENKKLFIARMLANQSNLLKESVNSIGTQLGDVGGYKRFVLNVTTVAIPTLITPDLVITKPMTASTGTVAIYQFVAGSNKGTVKQGDVFNSPLGLGATDESRMQYSSSAVVENIAAAATSFTPAWTPVVGGKVELFKTASNEWEEKPLAEGTVSGLTAGTYSKARYIYNNAIIPQNDLPTLNCKLTTVSLEAKVRRLAVLYSSLAAYEAKIEGGFDLGDALQKQAVGELNFEIDTEVISELDKAAGDATASTTFNQRVPAGISLAQHYEGFASTVARAAREIYKRTKKYSANYMVANSNLLPIISMTKGWKAIENPKMNGPYLAGSLNGLKVYICDFIAEDRAFVGYNGGDLMTSAGVFGMFMPIMPTMLLEGPDGGNTQGWATMYDFKIVNANLLVAIKVEDKDQVILTKAAD